VHPALSKPGEVVMTYVVNTKDFWTMFNDLEVYFPRFLRVKFE
jgi:hypothetical protein